MKTGRYWLIKTEPSDYSFTDLQKEGETIWEGVRSALALKHLANMRTGDRAFIYHTGREKSIMGIAQIASDPFADPQSDDHRFQIVRVKPERAFAVPVSLKMIKNSGLFPDWELVRMSRLSVMPVSEEQWNTIVQWGN